MKAHGRDPGTPASQQTLQILLRKANSAARRLDGSGRRLLWRLRHPRPRGCARPLWIVGAQRSGTTMLGECFGRSPEVVYYPEHDTRAFRDFELREDKWRELVSAARHPVVAFKPLTSSHLAGALLAEYPQGRVIWVLRHPSDRARSAVTKFGRHNLVLLQRLARGERPDLWQTRGLGEADYAALAPFDFERMPPASASALFWYLRNSLFLRQSLEREERAMLACYEQFVADPAAEMARLCRHAGIAFSPRLVAGIHARSARCEWPADTDPRIRELCDGLYRRLAALASAPAAITTPTPSRAGATG